MVSTKRRRGSGLKELVGSGDRITVATLPFLVVGAILNALYPAVFAVGGPPLALRVIAIALLVPGLTIWIWSVTLILTRVPRSELITDGPYHLMKHPLYTSVALLVLPSIGLLVNTWLGVPTGVVLYVASKIYAPSEEAELARTFGDRWDAYCRAVKLSWL